jgi:hypothetical protein
MEERCEPHKTAHHLVELVNLLREQLDEEAFRRDAHSHTVQLERLVDGLKKRE